MRMRQVKVVLAYVVVCMIGLIGLVGMKYCERPQEPSLQQAPVSSPVTIESFLLNGDAVNGGPIIRSTYQLFSHLHTIYGLAAGEDDKRSSVEPSHVRINAWSFTSPVYVSDVVSREMVLYTSFVRLTFEDETSVIGNFGLELPTTGRESTETLRIKLEMVLLSGIQDAVEHTYQRHRFKRLYTMHAYVDGVRETIALRDDSVVRPVSVSAHDFSITTGVGGRDDHGWTIVFACAERAWSEEEQAIGYLYGACETKKSFVTSLSREQAAKMVDMLRACVVEDSLKQFLFYSETSLKSRDAGVHEENSNTPVLPTEDPTATENKEERK